MPEPGEPTKRMSSWGLAWGLDLDLDLVEEVVGVGTGVVGDEEEGEGEGRGRGRMGDDVGVTLGRSAEAD